MVESRWASLLNMPDDVLPPLCTYAAEYDDFRLEMKQWYSYQVPSPVDMSDDVSFVYSMSRFDWRPQPDGAFDQNLTEVLYATYTGDEADKAKYNKAYIGAVCKPWPADEARPYFQHYSGIDEICGSSSDGECFGFRQLEPDWNNPIFICGTGGYGFEEQSDRYAADFYLKGTLAAELELLPVQPEQLTEGGGDDA